VFTKAWHWVMVAITLLVILGLLSLIVSTHVFSIGGASRTHTSGKP